MVLVLVGVDRTYPAITSYAPQTREAPSARASVATSMKNDNHRNATGFDVLVAK